MLRKYGLLALWLSSIPAYLWAGGQVNSYVQAVEGHTMPYPTQAVLTCMMVSALEIAALYVVLRPASYQHHWKRAASALLLFAPVLLVSLLLLMHAPAYAYVHALWVTCLTVGLLVLSLHSAVSTLQQRRVRG